MNKDKLKELKQKYSELGEYSAKNDDEIALYRYIERLIRELDDSEVKHLYKKIEELESYNDELIRDNNQLRDAMDNQEVLSQEWIESNTSPVDDEGRLYVWKSDLQNAIVPKQELPVVPDFVAEWIEKCKEKDRTLSQAYNALNDENLNIIKWLYHEGDRNEKINLFARAWLDDYTVEEKKYVIKLGDEFYLQRYEIDNKNIVTPFRIIGHLKEVAIKFDNKEKAEKVAELVEGKVEELEE